MGNIMAGIPLSPAHLCLGRPPRFPAKVAVTSRVMRALASRPPRKEQERAAPVMCDVNKLGHSLVRADVALETSSWLRCAICDILVAVCAMFELPCNPRLKISRRINNQRAAARRNVVQRQLRRAIKHLAHDKHDTPVNWANPTLLLLRKQDALYNA